MVWEEVKTYCNVYLHFWNTYFTKLFLLFEFPRQLWNDFGTFRLSIILISCIWVESSARCFLSPPLIENSKPYQSEITTSISHSRKLERSFAEISWAIFEKSFELVVINILQYCYEINSSCTLIRISHKDCREYLSISISFNRLLLAVCLTAP